MVTRMRRRRMRRRVVVVVGGGCRVLNNSLSLSLSRSRSLPFPLPLPLTLPLPFPLSLSLFLSRFLLPLLSLYSRSFCPSFTPSRPLSLSPVLPLLCSQSQRSDPLSLSTPPQ